VQTPAPQGAWVLAKGPICYNSLSATWRLGGSNVRARPKHHLTLESWQNTRLSMAALVPRDASHCYYNIITYNKNSIIYTTTDNIFNIHTVNYK